MADTHLDKIKYRYLEILISLHLFISGLFCVKDVFLASVNLKFVGLNETNSELLLCIGIISYISLNTKPLSFTAYLYILSYDLFVTILSLEEEGLSRTSIYLTFLFIYTSYFIIGSKGVRNVFLTILVSLGVIYTETTTDKTHISANWFYLDFDILAVLSLFTILLLFTTKSLFSYLMLYHQRDIDNQALIRKLETTQEHLDVVQKLEIVGKVSGEIAHDFNNLLTGMNGYLELASDESQDETLNAYLQQVKACVDKASQLIKELLSLSRNRPTNPEVSDLNQLVRHNMNFLESVLDNSISINYQLEDNLSEIYIDHERFEQSYYNLIFNALDAMPNGGLIEVKTFMNNKYLNSLHKTWVGISIKDEGFGIDEEYREKIFEPFFTMKENGTGLGLSVVYGLVTQSDGKIYVESDHTGTKFTLIFPAYEGRPKSLNVDEGWEYENQKLDRTLESLKDLQIAIIDDNPEIVKLLDKFFKKHNINPIIFTSSEEALERINSMTNVDLVVTDLEMPNLSGIELINEISTTHFETKFIIMSGYFHDSKLVKTKTMLENPSGRIISLLEKPFSLTLLEQNVVDAFS